MNESRRNVKCNTVDDIRPSYSCSSVCQHHPLVFSCRTRACALRRCTSLSLSNVSSIAVNIWHHRRALLRSRELDATTGTLFPSTTSSDHTSSCVNIIGESERRRRRGRKATVLLFSARPTATCDVASSGTKQQRQSAC